MRTNLEQVFDKLLSYGAGTTRIALEDVVGSSKESLVVDAVMLIESFVLCGYERIDDIGGYFPECDGRTILIKEFGHQDTVGTVDIRCLIDGRIAQKLH